MGLFFHRVLLSLSLFWAVAATADPKDENRPRSCAFDLAKLNRAAAPENTPSDALAGPHRAKEYVSVDGTPSPLLQPLTKKRLLPGYVARYYSHSESGLPVEVSIRDSHFERFGGYESELYETSRLKQIQTTHQYLRRAGIQTLYLGWIGETEMLEEIRQNAKAFPIEWFLIQNVGTAFLQSHVPALYEINPYGQVPMELQSMSRKNQQSLKERIQRLEKALRQGEFVTPGITLHISGEGQLYVGHIENIYPYKLPVGADHEMDWEPYHQFFERLTKGKIKW